MGNPFTPTEHAAWSGLLGAFGRMSALIDADLRERFRLSHDEFEVLQRLATSQAGQLRIQDLAASSILTRSGMSRAVERLERAGYLMREQASEDRRGAYARLTDDGRRRFERVADEHVAFVREHFLSLFGEKELGQMAGFWDRVSGRAGTGAGPTTTPKGSRP
jgi:DNA-binding MarR family transcriptional regulator